MRLFIGALEKFTGEWSRSGWEIHSSSNATAVVVVAVVLIFVPIPLCVHVMTRLSLYVTQISHSRPCDAPSWWQPSLSAGVNLE